ncbi:MAG: hypothetical protein HYX79_03610 [Chloroflexi bacterium]|nr:hypothetical protein [Chloroflexota bacterium]
MKRILLIALIILVPFVLLDLFFGGHGEFPWSGIPGFFALFGLIGCVAIILISKWLGHHWLQHKEDYYERNDGDR